MLVRKYVDENGLAAMLATKKSAGVMPEVNLRIPLHAGDEAFMGGIHPVWQTSPEVQNRGISGPINLHKNKRL